ncbi:MAG TPA: DsrE family protein [Campylobacterales bacterium]|nr:DsrE family protein [Campylobacterales bacterium]
MNGWEANKNKLLILWSSGDIEVANKMVLMYGGVMMARGYWDEAVLMIWGPSVKLLCENQALVQKVDEIKASGVSVCACIACVDDYGLRERYEAMNIDVIHTGAVMTELLKDGWRCVSL